MDHSGAGTWLLWLLVAAGVVLQVTVHGQPGKNKKAHRTSSLLSLPSPIQMHISNPSKLSGICFWALCQYSYVGGSPALTQRTVPGTMCKSLWSSAL